MVTDKAKSIKGDDPDELEPVSIDGSFKAGRDGTRNELIKLTPAP